MKLVKNPTSFDLVIPESVEAKIRHLCSRVHDIEWSGTLFYTVEGSLDDGTFKATCIDIFVMDVGTAGATVFKDTEDIIAYRLEHRETLLRPGVYEALIHSHNNMNAFFSGVDDNTLIAEGTDLNHFLSLVVCNAGNYVARITRKLKTVIEAEAQVTYKKTVQYSTYEDQVVTVIDGETSQGTQKGRKEETIIEYFDLNIQKAEVVEPFKDVDERLSEIKRNKSYGGKYFQGQSFQGQSFQGYPKIYDQFGNPYFNGQKQDDDKKEVSSEPVGEGKQMTIFGQEGDEEKQEPKVIVPSLPENSQTAVEIEEEPEEEVVEFYMTEKVPFHILKVLCTQLLCGSILASSRTTINLNEFVQKMDGLYQSRFGTLEDEYNELRLRDWIGKILEHIISYSVDKRFEDRLAKKYGMGDDYDYEESDAFIHLYACDMITFLEDLPKSDVKDIMIEELVRLMPPDYENSLRD